MNTINPLASVMLRAGFKPEEQHAYAKEFIDDKNVTGYLGKVLDITNQDGVNFITIERHLGDRVEEELHITGEILFSFENERMIP